MSDIDEWMIQEIRDTGLLSYYTLEDAFYKGSVMISVLKPCDQMFHNYNRINDLSTDAERKP